MQKIILPTILVATIAVAGIIALMPVEKASTASNPQEATQDQIAALIRTSSASIQINQADSPATIFSPGNGGVAFVTVNVGAPGDSGVEVSTGATTVAKFTTTGVFTISVPVGPSESVFLSDAGPNIDDAAAGAKATLIEKSPNPP